MDGFQHWFDGILTDDLLSVVFLYQGPTGPKV